VTISTTDLIEANEKQLIRDFFNNKKTGICVEVGSNEPLSDCSQSFHLEHKLQWECVLIEPNPHLAIKARKLRPNSIVFEGACTTPDSVGTLQLNIPLDENNQEITGHAGLEKNADEHNYKHHKIIDVQANTLTNILNNFNIANIDFLSIDVEGAELEVLQGLDFKRFTPQLILLEDKHLYLQKHLLLKRQGYKLVRRYNRNCWYIPKHRDSPKEPLLETLRLMKRMYLTIWFKKLHYAFRHKTLKPLLTL
jgi:FkbM family methyltransferase